MWIELFLALALCCSLLYIPGYFGLRICGYSKFWSTVAAPGLYLCTLCIIGEVFALVPGKISLWIQQAAVIAVLILGSYLVRALTKNQKISHLRTFSLPRSYIGAYLAIGALSFITMFWFNVASPLDICQQVDLGHHSNVSRAIMDSCHMTSLHQGFYMTGEDLAIAPWRTLGFYPSCFHFLVASIASMTGMYMTLCINATTLSFACIVFPLSVLACLSQVFPDNKKMILAGALFCEAFVYFPWTLMVFCPLLPNLAAFCLMPLIFAWFIGVCEGSILQKSFDRASAFQFIVASIALAMLHPSAIFSCAVYLMPYCVGKVMLSRKQYHIGKLGVSSFVAGWILVLCWMGLFIGMSQLGLVKKMATYDWGVSANIPEALINCISARYVGGFYTSCAMWPVAILIFIGGVYLWRKKPLRWLVVSYVLICILTINNAATSWAPKRLIGSFWYTDPCRFSAMCAIFALPLAAAGLICTLEFIGKFKADDYRKKGKKTLSAALIAALLIICYSPVSPGGVLDCIGWPYANMSHHFSETFAYDEPYSYKEREFLYKAMEEEGISKDDVILNEPYDGSKYGYGFDGIRMYFRPNTGYDYECYEEEVSKTLRLHLNEYGQNPKVQKAVKAVGAKYVLQLTDEHGDVLPSDQGYETFAGILKIDENTKGFKLVAHQGNMKLYKILDLD